MSAPSDRTRRRPESPGAQAWQFLFELTQASKPHLEAIASEFELTPMQAWTLRVLVANESPTMSGLASSLGCDASNATGIVDKLESRGFVERRAAAHDRRVKSLVVTPSGKAVHTRLEARMEQPPPAIANLSDADQRLLCDVLRRALDSLETPAAAEAVN